MLMLSSHHPSGSLIIFYFFLVWTGLSVMANDIQLYNSNNTNWIKKSDVQHAVGVLKAVMRNISVYLEDMETVKPTTPKCLKVQCRIICFNGKHNEIARDISGALTDDESISCEIIDELHLYNYKFTNGVVPVGFLAPFTNKIRLIHLGISNITAFENGAFGDGIFTHIVLEDLRLESVDKGFFLNISKHFRSMSIMQDNIPLQSVYPDFLDYVKFQIEYLRLQAGITCIRNITATDPILGTLVHVDFSYNNFSDQLMVDTFRKLTMVERLVLSHSNIMHLPNYIFQEMKYLELLDISYNKLTTLSKLVFGIQDISSNLRIYANYNEWHCDCQLQQEMNAIFKEHSSKSDVYCMTPEEYVSWTVCDERLCEGKEATVATAGPPAPPSAAPTTVYTTTTTRKSTTSITTSTQTMTTTSMGGVYVPTISTAGTVSPNEIVPLECIASNNSSLTSDVKRPSIRWPKFYFIPTVYGALTVKISVEQKESSSTFGLFWFSKTTKEYIMMELLPDEFGLGCYYTMPAQTIVTDLVPNVAYTFCLVDDQQNNVSPFSCKSIHVGGNINTSYNAWLSRNMRAKGISLMVFGIVIFMFIGIMTVFLVLKNKPIWLKGSKRIIKPKYSSGEIVVLPRANTAEHLKYKEDMLSRINEHRIFSLISRNNSMESLASTDSYMNANLYEIIPAYITFDKVPQQDAPSQPGFDGFDSCYWRSQMTERNSVRYAQITPRTKRISSDPLPAIPSDVYDIPQ